MMALHGLRMMHSSIIFLCLAVLTSSVTAAVLIATILPYGHPCKRDIECQHQLLEEYSHRSLPSYFADKESECKNGRCKCNEYIQLRIFRKGNFACIKGYSNQNTYGICNPHDPNTCIGGTCKKDFIESHCKCRDGSLVIGNTCRKILQARHSDDCTTPYSGPVPVCDYNRNLRCNDSDMKCACFKDYFYDREGENCITAMAYAELYPNETLAGLGEFCGTKDNLPKTCGEKDNMYCQNSTCKCKREFYPVESNGTCETKQSFAEANNLTSYKVKPGDYCYNDDDCITGLDCYNNKCDCPYPCTYDNRTISCNCGKVSATEGASRAILVGILGGFVIIIFWWRMIKKTLRQGEKKSKVNRNYEVVTSEHPLDPVPPPTPQPPSYTTDPTTDYSLSPRHSSVPTPYHSSLPFSTSNPAANTPYPLNPDQATVPGFSSFPKPDNSAIPASAPNFPPSDTIQPPPYTPQPPSYTLQPPPYTPTAPNDISSQPAVDIYKPIIS